MKALWVSGLVLTSWAGWASGQSTSLISRDHLKALIAESSGELGLGHFRNLLAFSGYAPSLGAEQTARYLADRGREFGLTDVRVEQFPADGRTYYWAFRTEPWWEGKRAELWLLEPERERIASFDVHRGHLARFSRSARVKAELVDVGAGTDPAHYQGKSVAGKLVLASGPVGLVHQRAVWEREAAGVLIYRTQDHLEDPDLVGSMQIEPWEGPNGESPGFAFSLSYRTGSALAGRLRAGERLVVEAEVSAETRAGHYPQVHAILPGREPALPEVWIQAHSNHRNTGGGNNLTGVGATLELARSLAVLIEGGELPRPRRSIHFVWGAEHAAIIYYFYKNPEAMKSVLALLNLDMVGDHQKLSKSILRLYRTPHSLPSFVNDIVQEIFETVAAGNSFSIRNRPSLEIEPGFRLPIVDPSGSRDPFYYQIEEFWGPSDHENVAEASIGIHAVLLNTWPDPYIGTQKDTVERADATQMKRAVVIAGASALILASAGSKEIPPLTQNALEKARARLAAEERRAMDLVLGSSADTAAEDYREAVNILRQAYRREGLALETLSVFAQDQEALAYLREMLSGISLGEEGAKSRLARHAEALGKDRGFSYAAVPPPPGPAASLVPVRSPDLRGPIHFFRPQYGQDWLATRLKDSRFREKIRLARRGHYYLYETLNFADGKRNLGQIRDLVAAEYGPAPLEEIEEYFRLLERAGAARFR